MKNKGLLEVFNLVLVVKNIGKYYLRTYFKKLKTNQGLQYYYRGCICKLALQYIFIAYMIYIVVSNQFTTSTPNQKIYLYSK